MFKVQGCCGMVNGDPCAVFCRCFRRGQRDTQTQKDARGRLLCQGPNVKKGA